MINTLALDVSGRVGWALHTPKNLQQWRWGTWDLSDLYRRDLAECALELQRHMRDTITTYQVLRVVIERAWVNLKPETYALNGLAFYAHVTAKQEGCERKEYMAVHARRALGIPVKGVQRTAERKRIIMDHVKSLGFAVNTSDEADAIVMLLFDLLKRGEK